MQQKTLGGKSEFGVKAYSVVRVHESGSFSQSKVWNCHSYRAFPLTAESYFRSSTVSTVVVKELEYDETIELDAV